MKIKCVIPVKLHSERVDKKNLRLLGNKPLVEHIIDTVIKVLPKEDIYLYSHYDKFREITNKKGINFLKELTEPKQGRTNNDFIYEIFNMIDCDYILMANSTSPFITTTDIKKILGKIYDGYEIILSVNKIKAEIYDNTYKPLTFDTTKKIDSQMLDPIYQVVWGLTAWNKDTFLKNYDSYGCGVFGTNKDRIYYLELNMPSSLDIDTEEDFQLAEAYAKFYKDISEKNLDKTLIYERDRYDRYWSKHLKNNEIGGYEWGDPYDELSISGRGWKLGNYKYITTELLIPNIKDKTVLEIGCGGGKWTNLILKYAKQLTSVDISIKSINHVRNLFKSNDKLRLYKTDGNELLGISDNSIDCIFSMDALARLTIENLDKYLSEFYRVLKPNGIIIVHVGCNTSEISREINFTNISPEQIITLCKKNNLKYELDTTNINHGALIIATKE